MVVDYSIEWRPAVLTDPPSPRWHFRGHPDGKFSISSNGIYWTNLDGIGLSFLTTYWRGSPVGAWLMQWLSEQRSLKRLEMAADYMSAMGASGKDPHDV